MDLKLKKGLKATVADKAQAMNTCQGQMMSHMRDIIISDGKNQAVVREKLAEFLFEETKEKPEKKEKKKEKSAEDLAETTEEKE